MTMPPRDRYGPIAIADSDDIGVNPSVGTPIFELIESRLSRRGALLGSASAFGLFAGAVTLRAAGAEDNPSTLTFAEIEHGIDERDHAPAGYGAKVLIRWGDPVVPSDVAFEPSRQTAAAQETQFGFNNDYIAYMPLPHGSRASDHGLLGVNHEYTSTELMFPGLTADNRLDAITRDQVDIEMAAHGVAVVEVKRDGGSWSVVSGSQYARRISLASTRIRVGGPAAGHDALKTSSDPAGTQVIGTLNNCAGGMTPWGTVLTAEENFHQYFGGDPAKTPSPDALERYGVAGERMEYAWSRFHDRFNVEKEPNEPNRFGWVVEYDPYDAASVPVKRTALGRFKHENAHCVVNRDGRVVVYSGDDERFEYVYKFVTAGTFDPNDRAANINLLDEGTLHVATFDDGGGMLWLPLVHGQGPLTADNGFASQGDVVIWARKAADLLGATPMDRPEWVVPNPVNGRVYAALTNNAKREFADTNAMNPRAENTTGHIIEMIPPGTGADVDHAAESFTWDMFLIAGNPVFGATLYGKGLGKHGWFACPDAINFDGKGRMWIGSDQGGSQAKFGTGDGVWACDVKGDGRALTRFFYRLPSGAETCGMAFTPDDTTLFVAVQHPAEQKDSTFDAPATRWPDFADDMPPRPSIVALTKDDGGVIGS
jgi:secreted PhoX family phosphatase